MRLWKRSHWCCTHFSIRIRQILVEELSWDVINTRWCTIHYCGSLDLISQYQWVYMLIGCNLYSVRRLLLYSETEICVGLSCCRSLIVGRPFAIISCLSFYNLALILFTLSLAASLLPGGAVQCFVQGSCFEALFFVSLILSQRSRLSFKPELSQNQNYASLKPLQLLNVTHHYCFQEVSSESTVFRVVNLPLI